MADEDNVLEDCVLEDFVDKILVAEDKGDELNSVVDKDTEAEEESDPL